jgi:dihydrofolate synthase/folylpolyglutamate synthase
MDYRETLDYLYTRLPMFTRIGAAAYKDDLDNTIALCEALGNPQNSFKSIHIAGTNGKGSVSHMTSAVLQKAGYKTGLYTSPHLVDFRERIRINGQPIPEDFVVDFVDRVRPLIESIEPSFFELTVAMAFEYFAQEKVDCAVIETGLGGRLDSTNVITPVLSIITNISFDHMNLLGDTLEQIATEKAGIIKQGIPVLIGERQPESEKVFRYKSWQMQAPVFFAEDRYSAVDYEFGHPLSKFTFRDKQSADLVKIQSDLGGRYQVKNITTVLSAAHILRKDFPDISFPIIEEALKEVKPATGLRGRWDVLQQKPLVICDVAHNEAGLKEVFSQVESIPHKALRIVYGMVRDKDVPKALGMLPQKPVYYFCAPDIPRALPVEELTRYANELDLQGEAFPSVAAAFAAAKAAAGDEDLVLVVGSIFVAGEVLAEE